MFEKRSSRYACFEGFHEWLCKTNFSFLHGASHPLDLIQRANELGYRGLCINDFDGVYGLARCWRELEFLKQEGLHQGLGLNYGAEIHFQKDHELPVLLQDTLVLVARNAIGYRNLNRLLSYAHRDGKHDANVPFEYLQGSELKGLVAILPMRGLLRQRESTHRHEALKALFGDDYYLSVSRHLHPAEDCWIRQTLDTAKQYALPTLLSQDVFFHDRSQKCVSDLLQAIRTNETVDQCQAHHFANAERCLHKARELYSLFSDIPGYQQALERSRTLYERCDFDLSELSYHYPKEMIPAGYDAMSYLVEQVWQGARERIEGPLPDKLCEQIEHELTLIRQLDFADYFLTVWDIVSWARAQQILCQGRGSAANSAVCYVLGITSVNPQQFDLLFERFISMERGDPPDIDVDFEHERREEVIQYIYQRYGRQRAAMVANVVTFRGKGALRAVGKALGIEEGTLGQMSKVASSRLFRGTGTDNIVRSLQQDHEKAQPGAPPVNWQLWADLSVRLHGFPRHLGIHSGGFMLSDQPLDRLLPQEPATMEGRTIVQWSKEDIEALGFFKIDLLSLGMLSAMRKCFDTVEQYYGKHIRMHSIPVNDAETYAMIQRAETVGTFQIESRAQMSMLPRLKPACFYDLVIEVAIIRPGPIQGQVIHPYLARRDGLQPVTYPDPRLEPILRRTLGIAIFQEQAMRIAIAVGNFTGGEADALRKNIGSWGIKNFDRDLNPLLVKLEQGMRDNGIGDEFAEQILGQMQGFAEYGFPESHAVSFALIAYASCFLKCHYPAAFYISVINSQPMGFYSPHALLQTAQREGVRLLPLSLNHSTWDLQLEKQPGRPDYAIRLGFRLVTGLSQRSAEKIVELRGQCGGWDSFEAFVRHCELPRDEITVLAFCDIFRDFGDSRAQALWKAEAVPYQPMLDDQEATTEWRAESSMQRIQNDFQAFKTTLGHHPAYVIKNEQWPYRIPLHKLQLSTALNQLPTDIDVFVFGMVLVKQSPGSAKGMVFVTLEDEAGFINLALPPPVYARHYQLVDRQPFLCVVGQLQRVNESHSVLVKRVFDVQSSASLVSLSDKPGSLSQAESLSELVKPRAFH